MGLIINLTLQVRNVEGFDLVQVSGPNISTFVKIYISTI
jgi:hypothetical protein